MKLCHYKLECALVLSAVFMGTILSAPSYGSGCGAGGAFKCVPTCNYLIGRSLMPGWKSAPEDLQGCSVWANNNASHCSGDILNVGCVSGCDMKQKCGKI